MRQKSRTPGRSARGRASPTIRRLTLEPRRESILTFARSDRTRPELGAAPRNRRMCPSRDRWNYQTPPFEGMFIARKSPRKIVV